MFILVAVLAAMTVAAERLDKDMRPAEVEVEEEIRFSYELENEKKRA